MLILLIIVLLILGAGGGYWGSGRWGTGGGAGFGLGTVLVVLLILYLAGLLPRLRLAIVKIIDRSEIVAQVILLAALLFGVIVQAQTPAPDKDAASKIKVAADNAAETIQNAAAESEHRIEAALIKSNESVMTYQTRLTYLVVVTSGGFVSSLIAFFIWWAKARSTELHLNASDAKMDITSAKIDENTLKTLEVLKTAETIHTLTNSTLSEMTTKLQIALERIGGLEALVVELRDVRSSGAVKAAAPPKA